MGTGLATLTALAAIGLLLALDPGGAIAESGFPDYRDMDWKQLIAWGFRIAGIGFALLLMLFLRIRYRPSRRTKYRDSTELMERELTVLPAAAVSVLEDREVSGRTLLAAIVEMVQRGRLKFECVRTGSGYGYLLSQQASGPYGWERLICDILPSGRTSVQAVYDKMNEHKDAIGDQLGEFLQLQGLFRDNPIRVRREDLGEGSGWAMLAGILMGVGGGLWLALWLSQWWANSLLGAAIGCIYWFIAAPMNAGMLPPTEAGANAIGQWLGFKELLPGPDQADGGDEADSMLAYAIALDAAQPWLEVLVPAPRWLVSGEPGPIRARDLNLAFHGFISAPVWGLAGRLEGAAEAAARPRDRPEPARTHRRTSRTEHAERTVNQDAAEDHPVARQADAPEPEEALYQEGRVLLKRRSLALPGRNIALRRISSVWADQQLVETGESNWLLKAPGILITLGGRLVFTIVSFFLVIQLLFHALHWLGIIGCNPTQQVNCDPFEPYSAIAWVIHVGTVIGMAFLPGLVGGWLEDKGARKQFMPCAAVSVDGESEPVYFGHSAEWGVAVRLVEEVRRAQEAARNADDA